MANLETIEVGGVTYDIKDIKSRPIITKAQYDALVQAGQDDPDVDYHISDLDITGAPIDDNTPNAHKVFSSDKVNNLLKTTTFEVGITGWSSDTTSQSGTTLYVKTIALNNRYDSRPNIDIDGANGTGLPTVAQQNAFNLLQYVMTEGGSSPYMKLFSSAIPTTAYYIKVRGVD